MQGISISKLNAFALSLLPDTKIQSLSALVVIGISNE